MVIIAAWETKEVPNYLTVSMPDSLIGYAQDTDRKQDITVGVKEHTVASFCFSHLITIWANARQG